MKFGITIKPDIPVERIVTLTKAGRAGGIRLWLDFRFPRFVERAFSPAHIDGDATSNMRLGPCVTNPAVRDVDGYSQSFRYVESDLWRTHAVGDRAG